MIAFSIFWFNIYWYWIFYAISFILWFFYVKYILNQAKYIKIFNKELFLDDLLFYIVLWVLLWWRLGYVFFYNFSYFLENPIKIFYIHEWWMAFAGAFIWVGISLFLLAKKYKISYFTITDLIVSFLPFWLWLGRIWNYLNKELYWITCPDFLNSTFYVKTMVYDD